MPEDYGANRAAGEADAAALKLLRVVADLLRESGSGVREHEVHLDASLESDLGLDSLARAELLLRIERAFDVHLPEGVLGTAETPRDLLNAALQAKAGPRAVAPEQVISPATAHEAVAVPERADTLLQVLDWHASAHPQRTHLMMLPEDDGVEPWSFAQLRGDAVRIAARLGEHGVGSGDAVALMLPTCREFFALFFGILYAGAVPVPMYPPARIAHLADHLGRQAGILVNCRATILVSVREAQRYTRLLRDRVPSLRKVLSPADLAGSPRPPVPALPAVAGDDTALLQYTSGSTGDPKGVILTHANLLANIRAMGKAAEIRPTDVFVSWLPLYHDMGLIGAWLGSLHFAIPLVIMPPTAFLARPLRWLWAIHRYRGTLSSAPNFAYEMLGTRTNGRGLEALDLSSWRMAFNGAEPVSAGTLSRFAERFAPYGFRRESLAPVYGLAESAVGLSFPPPERGPRIDRVDREALAGRGVAQPAREADADPLLCVACGRPLPGHEIRVADGEGRELPERSEGRVQFRGPSATRGYLNNPEATKRLFQDGWLNTGDLGYMAGGELFITGRAKDLIIRGGRHVHPQELEQAAGSIPGVRKGCVVVFGVPDTRMGTEKLVMLAETRLKDPRQRQALHTALAGLSQRLLGSPPDDIVLVAPYTVLKTSSGKIRRAASSELYQRGLLGASRPARTRQLAQLGRDFLLRRAARLAREGRDGVRAAGVALLCALLACLAWTACALPRRAGRRAVLRAIARAFLRGSGLRLEVQGGERLEAPGPAIVAANHASYLDGIILFALLPERFAFVAKRELQGWRGVARVLRAVDTVFVERSIIELSLADAQRLSNFSRKGRSLVFFPEGGFTRAPGLQRFHMGAFLAAAASATPVLPVALRGTRSALRAGEWRLRPGTVEVELADFLRPDGPDWAAAVRLRARVRAEVLARCGEPDLDAPPPTI